MFFLLCCNVSYAEQYSINLYYKHYDDNVEIGIGERSINIIPSVYYDTDNGFLSIISQNIIKNVNIKITNSYGQVKWMNMLIYHQRGGMLLLVMFVMVMHIRLRYNMVIYVYLDLLFK